MNPVCIKCQKEMKCKVNGVSVAPSENPSHQYNGDKFQCPICGVEIVIGFGNSNHSEQPADILLKSS